MSTVRRTADTRAPLKPSWQLLMRRRVTSHVVCRGLVEGDLALALRPGARPVVPSCAARSLPSRGVMRHRLSDPPQAAAVVCGLPRQGLRRPCLLSLRARTGLLDSYGKICCKQSCIYIDSSLLYRDSTVIIFDKRDTMREGLARRPAHLAAACSVLDRLYRSTPRQEQHIAQD